jgi:hypothetical protein
MNDEPGQIAELILEMSSNPIAVIASEAGQHARTALCAAAVRLLGVALHPPYRHDYNHRLGVSRFAGRISVGGDGHDLERPRNAGRGLP